MRSHFVEFHFDLFSTKQEVCSHLSDESASDDQLMSHLADAVAVWFNYTGTAKCLNLSEQATSALDDNGWDYQVIFGFDQLLILLHIYLIYGFVNLFVFHLISWYG